MSDLADNLRPLVAFLEGRDPPPSDVLQRLYDLSPHFRLTWLQGTLDRVIGQKTVPGRPGYWKVWEVRPGNAHDKLRRAAGYARLQRLRKRKQEKQEGMAADFEYCQAMMNGLHFVGAWPEQPIVTKELVRRRVIQRVEHRFGSDAMFREFAEAEIRVRQAVAKLDSELRRDDLMNDAADADSLSELEDNPELRAQLRDTYRQAATEDWGIVCNGRNGAVFEKTLKEGLTDGTDGEPLAGSGQGLQSGRLEETAGGMG